NATTPTGGALTTPSLLANKLIYVGYPNNEYLQFSTSGSTVSIDPTYGLDADGTSAMKRSADAPANQRARSTWKRTRRPLSAATACGGLPTTSSVGARS